MKKNTLIIANIISVIILLAAGIYYFRSTQTAEAHVHKHAGFQIYVDGAKQDFSDFSYMSFQPCGEEKPKKLSPEEEQLEKAHLHDGVGDVGHVHREGATWEDLLQNLNFKFDEEKEIAGYTENQTVPDILSQQIEDRESVVIVIGDQSAAPQYLEGRVTQEAISAVESSSELCGAGTE